MSRVRILLTGISTLALVAAFSTTGFAAKTVIMDEELDQVTAAGEPKIAMVSHSIALSGDVYAYNNQGNWFTGTLEEGSQDNLRAITLNNVFGENQVATGVNINTRDGGVQSNDITQSWGSAKAVEGGSVDGVASSGDNVAAAAANAAAAAANAQANTNLAEKIVASDQENANAQTATAAATATNNQVQNHAAAQGVLSVLWMFADEIATVDNSIGDNITAENYVDTSITGVIEGGAQNEINALTVNNVFGLNQVANALNIASGDISFDPLNVAAGSSAGASNQSNTINQYRGAPFGWTDAPVFSTQ